MANKKDKKSKKEIIEKVSVTDDDCIIGIITNDYNNFHEWIKKNSHTSNCNFTMINDNTNLFGLEFKKVIKIKGSENISKAVIQQAQNRIKE